MKDSFAENVLKREEVFPTGLLINDVGIAIPHTDAEHVNDSQIAFMSLKTPVTFYEMGTADKEISVSLIFMLALKEPHATVRNVTEVNYDVSKKRGGSKASSCK